MDHLGTLYVVGIGPGGADGMTAAARDCLEHSEVIVGYNVYNDLVREIFPDKEYLSTGMTREVERCRMALEAASFGRTVSLICSGDAGIYGLASPVLEAAVGFPKVQVRVVPGVTAAASGAALLGAPLTGDFAVISLSDRLTPWEKIEKRLSAAAEADFVLVLYNPVSKSRPEHLRRAISILLRYRAPETVCGVARNIGRPGESCELTTLEALGKIAADMFTTVFIGAGATRIVDGHMVTPRGYDIIPQDRGRLSHE